ncbi:DUF4838 domain-containing protein [Cohnella abietis]|uniref:Uncharacterized protein n=1 Tax=Cohnella abietis TaxID=2507935 RepID=A0A3T1DC15_9BACL|nr:DUF4838 domain-containing protein [Cohnella abietis]BBI35639.1 hypothetical protein KCTCHS21_50380 [Cohnella abietis]
MYPLKDDNSLQGINDDLDGAEATLSRLDIEGVKASNGTIIVDLSYVPLLDPLIEDFSVYQAVGDQPPVAVIPNAITWSSQAKKIVLSVPVLLYESLEQEVIYSVSYKKGTTVSGERIKISQGLSIISDGSAKCVIVAPQKEEDARAYAAACKLIKYLKLATGIELTLLPCSFEIPKHLLPVYIGVTGLNNRDVIHRQLQELDGDCFIIDCSVEAITIIGSSGWGTEFGVNEFLEAFAGVRWLLPGTDGEHVPIISRLTVPIGAKVEKPTFFSRTFGSADKSESWNRDNRIYPRIFTNHVMFHLFEPDKYLADHPEWYPTTIKPEMIGGWQPCYSNLETAEKAIELINKYFEENPNAESYSISVNDGGGYCEEDPHHPSYQEKKLNSLGMSHMSDHYFKWVQKVAEEVLAQHPDKYLAALAYHETYDPPSIESNVKLPSNVLVYITDERMNWASSERLQVGHSLTERWLEVAPGASFYDYFYGGPYVLPRPYFHQLADNCRYASEKGIAAFTSESPANFGEGPKMWLAAKLKWDATLDVDALLHDWYVHAVGAEAAPYLVKYYAHWEDFWQRRVYETEWFNSWLMSFPKTNFMSFTDASYLKIVDSSEIVQSRQWLESAVTVAKQYGTSLQGKRAELLLRAFEYYEGSVLTYPGNLEAAGEIQSTDHALNLLDIMVERLTISEKRINLVEEFKSDPILSIHWPPDIYGMLWSSTKSSDVHALAEWVGQEPSTGAVRSRINSIITTASSMYAVHYAKLLLAIADQWETVNHNSSFEQGDGIVADDWWYWLEYGQTSEINLHRSQEKPRTGNYGLKMNGLYWGGPVYEISQISSGYYGMSAYYYVPEFSDTKGTLQIFVYCNDANGQWLHTFGNEDKVVANEGPGWHLADWVGHIPAFIDGVKVEKLTIGLKLTKFKDGEILYLDDIKFFNLG